MTMTHADLPEHSTLIDLTSDRIEYLFEDELTEDQMDSISDYFLQNDDEDLDVDWRDPSTLWIA